MKQVIIAEKPSVAKNIADAVNSKIKRDGYFEGDSFYITWAFGHLLELYDAKDYDEKMSNWRLNHYPFIPNDFKYKVKSDAKDKSKVDYGANKQLETIKELITSDDVSGVISACDYDREGQIIGDIIIEFLETHKNVDRLLLNEWTPKEIQKGLDKLVSNQTLKPLRDAGISRQWADWTIGINLTSVATLKYQRGSGKPLKIGRVLLPTLKIIYDRDIEIENFVSDTYYKLICQFETKNQEVYEGVFNLDKKDKFNDSKQLLDIKNIVDHHDSLINNKTSEKKNEYPQGLFNLSNLQGHVTSKYKGWSSDKVLKVAQDLYEKKFLTYPRTASVALDESLIDKTKKVLDVIKKDLPYEDEVVFSDSKRVFDNRKVESHSAIIPTYIIPGKLSEDERIVYESVKNRFIMQFMPVAEYEEATIETIVEKNGFAGSFISKGRIQLVEGWKKVEKVQSKDTILPNVNIKDHVKCQSSAIDEKSTKPPKRHNEKTLLRVMETCGKKYKEEDSDEMISAILSGFSIGTPATRAETIQKLKSVGYITTKGKSLLVTEMGRKLVECFPIKDLFDLEYTGKLEKVLSEIGKGTIPMSDFLSDINNFTNQSVDLIKKDAFHIIDQGEMREIKDREVIGTCPHCKSDVIVGEKGYGCTNWKGGCQFIVWKNDKFLNSLKVRVTKDTVKLLLEHGKVYSKEFVSKKGNKFEAVLTYEKNLDNDYFSWKMHFR